MTEERFNKLVDEIIERTRQTLQTKGREYARGDRLSNFKKAGHLQDTTPEKALGGMLAKHVVSLYDMLNDAGRGLHHPITLWQEKLQDIINYCILLEALLYEGYEHLQKGGEKDV